jgi:hypothetical protein
MFVPFFTEYIIQVARTGLYLSEKEEVGTVQQLDIVA